MNDQIIIHIPDWMVWAVGIWVILSAVNEGLNLYKKYLQYKIEKLNKR